MTKTKVCPNCNNDYAESMTFCLNCGGVLKNKDKIINCTFEYKCPFDWNNLEKSPIEDVRFCLSCKKNVHFAHSQGELNKLAAEGKCVAFIEGSERNTPPEIPPLMDVIAKPEGFTEFRPTMGIPVSLKKEEKKPWWKFWK